MTIVIVKMSIPKVKIAVLKNLLIFGEKYLPQSVRLLEGGGVESLFGRIPFEHAVSLYGASLRGGVNPYGQPDRKISVFFFDGFPKSNMLKLLCYLIGLF